jgi:hypothetical protein
MFSYNRLTYSAIEQLLSLYLVGFSLVWGGGVVELSLYTPVTSVALVTIRLRVLWGI